MHVRKVEIFIYSLFSPAEKLSLPKRLKSDLTPIIWYSNKENASQPISSSQTMSEISKFFMSDFENFHKYQIISFNIFFI